MKRMGKIKKSYDDLIEAFGPQGWWPIVNNETLLCEYHVNSPKSESEALEICFGSILAQNTSWKNAEKAIINLKKNNILGVKKIISAENKKLSEIIKSSGYHNQKTKKLKNFCEFLLKNHNGRLDLLFNKRIDEIRKELLSVNGIGPETADSIILYAARKPIFVIDSYTKRILGRIGYGIKEYAEFQELFMQSLPNNERLFNEYHALLVTLAKNVCRKKPLCEKCPLNKYCVYFYKQKWKS